MGDVTIEGGSWRFVELGRVVLLAHGPDAGKLGAIVEIIDHKRVLVDGPSSDSKLALPRQELPLSNALLTNIVIAKLPRGARTGTVRSAWEKAEVDKQWAESNWAKRKLQQERRKGLSDFDRYKVLRLKKQRRFEERKALHKIRASAKA